MAHLLISIAGNDCFVDRERAYGWLPLVSKMCGSMETKRNVLRCPSVITDIPRFFLLSSFPRKGKRTTHRELAMRTVQAIHGTQVLSEISLFLLG